MKLYTNPFSPNGRKVLCLAGYLGIDLEVQDTRLLKGDHKTESFLAMNPNGKIPVLEDGDFVLWESNAMLLYLAGNHPERGLLPADHRERCLVERWLFWQIAHFSPPMGRLMGERIFKRFRGIDTVDTVVIDAATRDLDVFCAVLDRQLADRPFVCGDAPTVADFAIGAWADTAPLVSYDYSAVPNLASWVTRVVALPGWVPTPPMPF